MAGTKVEDATYTATHTSPNIGDYYVPLGKAGITYSINILLSEIKAYVGNILDRIVSGTSSVIISSTKVENTIAGTLTETLNASGRYPNIATFDLGTSSNKYKNLWLSGGINVGSDSQGDIYYRDSAGKFQRLGVGSNGQVLTLDTGIPKWKDSVDVVQQTGRISLTANSSTSITFSNPFSSAVDSDIVVTTSCYDSNGDNVVVNIKSITTTGFTAESSVNGTLHFNASIKS